MADRGTSDEGLAFFGKVTAGQSHELTNVLNIIHELAGLQRDLLAGAGEPRPAASARVEQIAARIQALVERGAAIIRAMNRFAHSVDAPRVLFDVAEVLGRTVFLAERPARLAETELAAELPEAGVVIEGNPFALQMAVFGSIEAALLAGGGTRRITVACRLTDGGIAVRVERAGEPARTAAVEARLESVRHAVALVGGSFEILEGANGFVVTIPGKPAGRPGDVVTAEENDHGQGAAGR